MQHSKKFTGIQTSTYMVFPHSLYFIKSETRAKRITRTEETRVWRITKVDFVLLITCIYTLHICYLNWYYPNYSCNHLTPLNTL